MIYAYCRHFKNITNKILKFIFRKWHLYCYYYQKVSSFPWVLDLVSILIYILLSPNPTFQQALVIMLGANMSQAPHAPEDRSVSPPVVTIEASKQFTTYRETPVKKISILFLDLTTMYKPQWHDTYPGLLHTRPYEINTLLEHRWYSRIAGLWILTLPLPSCVN